MKHYSPLRYPGGKARLAFYIKSIIEKNNLYQYEYLEPYAGGASVALELLFLDYVSYIHINDLDYAIYSFWNSVINNTDELCKKINDTKINIEEWFKQKEVAKDFVNHSLLEVGFATFFLNRTNRSGILKAGVIGGLKQSGKWKLDARFNKKDLIRRIQSIGLYRNQIKIYNEDALDLMRKMNNKAKNNIFYYLDPPYYYESKNLYTNYYSNDDHKLVAELLKTMNNKYWLLSYDNAPFIQNLYSNYKQCFFEINYSASKAYKGVEIFILSNSLELP